MTAGLLLLLAVALLWPVPALLSRSRSALRHPAAALLAWQAVGLGGGLATIGAGLAYGHGGAGWIRRGAAVAAWALAAYLLAVAAVVTVRTLARRRRHRALLDLVGARLPGRPPTRSPLPAKSPPPRNSSRKERSSPNALALGEDRSFPTRHTREARLLDSPTALAYCVPGLRPRLVLTTAAWTDLSPDALAAVVAHERAHLRQRHDLVVLPFVAWLAALPFLPGARTARTAVALLVEALADDVALARVGPAALREALHCLRPLGGPGERVDPGVAVRLARLGPER